MKTRALIVLALIYTAHLNLGLCHDTPVHFQITIAAVKASTGFANYLQDNKIANSKQYSNAVPIDLDPSLPFFPPTASGLVEDGGVWEDNNGKDQGGTRSFNHFYDPISKQGLSASGFGLSRTFGIPSEAWAANNNATNTFSNPPGVNVYSWQNARTYQSNAIIGVASSVRDGQAGKMFRSIGQVMHLLEDTTQPQHVRNEQHLDQFPDSVPIVGGNDTVWRSKFEDWGRFNMYRYKPALIPTNLDWVNAGFTKMSDFWDRNLYDGSSFAPLDANEHGGSTLGLAEFCNGNFLTVRGTYAEYTNDEFNGANKIGVTSYPYPSIASTDLSNFQANPGLFGKYQSDGTCRYTLAKSRQGVAIRQHCALDLLTCYYPTRVNAVHPDDPDVMMCYHTNLIPRAIAYSSGLLDYYFRGRLEIECSSTNWSSTSQRCDFIARNISPWGRYDSNGNILSTQAFKGGCFRVFWDDSSGNRTEATDLVTTYTNYLAPNDYIIGSFGVPAASTGVFTLAYFGTIGVDGNSNTLDAVDANIGCASVVWSNNAYQGCNIPITYRTVYGTLNNTDGTLAGNSNYLAWLTNFNFDNIDGQGTQQLWGTTTYVTFDNPDDTSPVIVTYNYPDGGYPYSWEFLYYSLGGLVPSDNSIAGWSQVLLQVPQTYMVLAEGFTTPEGLFISVKGCTSACTNKSIVTLPLPDASLGYQCQQYLFARVGPNPNNTPTGVYPDLNTFAAIVCSNYGVNWNPDQSCGCTNDPFH